MQWALWWPMMSRLVLDADDVEAAAGRCKPDVAPLGVVVGVAPDVVELRGLSPRRDVRRVEVRHLSGLRRVAHVEDANASVPHGRHYEMGVFGVVNVVVVDRVVRAVVDLG